MDARTDDDLALPEFDTPPRRALTRTHPAPGRLLRPHAGSGSAAAARLAAEASLATLGAVVAVQLAGLPVVPAAVALCVWMAAMYHDGVGAVSRMRAMVPALGGAFSLTMAGAGAGVALGVLDRPQVLAAMIGVTAATISAVAVGLFHRATRPSRVLVAGERQAVDRLLETWTRSQGVDVVETHVVDPSSQREHVFGTHVRALARWLNVDTVVVAPGADLGPEHLRQLSWALEGTGIHLGVAGPSPHIARHRARAGTLGGHLVIEVGESRRSALVRLIKSAADRAGAAVLLVPVAPLLAVLCLLVRRDSPGPAIFKQQRVGQGGKVFTLYKLRTMCEAAEDLKIPLQRENPSQMLFKIKDDPRITRLGRILRRTSLDELPQLVNVLLGQMSLIGPRPALPDEVARYDGVARRRLAVKPGLTGLWQVSGRSDLSWDQSLALDLTYVDNWRLVDDAVLLARTVRAVLTSRGAY